MPLPPKELYTISEIANRWNVQSDTIKDFMLTQKLQASIFLPSKMLLKFTLQFNHQCAEDDDDPYIYDVDYADPDSFRSRQGLFELDYHDIEWDENGFAKLEKGEMFLKLPGEDGYFGFHETYVLKQDDVLISLPEVTRFEEEYGITFNDMALQASSPNEFEPASFVEFSSDSTVPKSLQYQKDNIENDKDQINPKRETTLLTIIAVLLEIISGEFTSYEVLKHPSIRNQEDLINKMTELETRGLGERNLQEIFALAKRTKSRN